MEPNWALIACGIAERTDTDLNTVDPTGDPKFPYNILIRNLMLGLQNAYRDSTKNNQEWHPIADAPRDGTRLLLWWPIAWQNTIVEGHYEGTRWRTSSRVRGEIGPTHYMPLPSPPEDAANGT